MSGNGLVVCVLANYRNLTNLTDICIFNLALSDLLFILMLPLYSHYSMASHWSFGDFMCRFAAASHKTGFFSSIFFMVVMSLDRYMVIIHGFKVAQYRTLKAGMAMSVVVWMLSLSVSLPSFIFARVTNESYGVGCDYDPDSNGWKLYNIFAINILGLVIPLLVMTACYFRIIPTLMSLRSAKKHRVIKLIISIVVAFFLFWAPYNISLFLKYLKAKGKLQGDECSLESDLKLAVAVTEAFAYTHCCLNPIIYAFVGQKFTKRAVQMLRNCMPCIPLPSTIDLSDSTYRKSSIMSRSSDVTSTFIK
uniref:C-C chemokine receptor type 4-like isoform X2 n=1 Tax=Scatophagus argus TaxID=75038 RepID=UPI001ED85019|nr:C-C chemokine receptor type 4-like isoform X2 [Scatophagus argus]